MTEEWPVLVNSHLCVNCYPKPVLARFIWFGLSLCPNCLEPRRKAIDKLDKYNYDVIPGVDKRDYKATWGTEPEED